MHIIARFVKVNCFVLFCSSRGIPSIIIGNRAAKCRWKTEKVIETSYYHHYKSQNRLPLLN